MRRSAQLSTPAAPDLSRNGFASDCHPACQSRPTSPIGAPLPLAAPANVESSRSLLFARGNATLVRIRSARQLAPPRALPTPPDCRPDSSSRHLRIICCNCSSVALKLVPQLVLLNDPGVICLQEIGQCDELPTILPVHKVFTSNLGLGMRHRDPGTPPAGEGRSRAPCDPRIPARHRRRYSLAEL